MKRILFVSQAPLKKELGAAKVIVELAEEMEKLGWTCELTALMDLVPGPIQDGGEVYAMALGEHLRRHAGEFDVVDFDHCYLPFARKEFSSSTLLVARSVLLAHHLLDMRTSRAGIKDQLRSLLFKRRERARIAGIVRRAQTTMIEADLVNVANHGDEKTLIERGIPESKIAVLPYGLSCQRRSLFDQRADELPAKPHVAFVGTFDNRKGANDLPIIAEQIAGECPGVVFSLLGTSRDRDRVLAKFPGSLRHKVNVLPSYPADALPDLLAPCTVGVFPSYLEGFGFGVLEMLAAGVPVIAYDVPGPPMMLPAEYIVPIGDRAAMGRKVLELLNDRPRLEGARVWARNRSRDFEWPAIARRTSDIYLARWEEKVARSRR